ncbi:MAG: PDDEXK nuclease domain-containing protein [Blastocatellia bacterium]
MKLPREGLNQRATRPPLTDEEREKLRTSQREDAGQMNFYLNYLKHEVAHPDENPPVGLILCTDKDAAEVHYATAGMYQQLFVSRYLAALPAERLQQWSLEEREQLRRAAILNSSS